LKDAPLNKHLHDHTKLANLGWDCTAKMTHLPILTKISEWIYCSSDWASINESTTNVFANIPEALASSTDSSFEVDLPHHDPLVYAQYTTSYYEVLLMQSIKLTGESKKHFCYFYLVPNSKALAEEWESAS